MRAEWEELLPFYVAGTLTEVDKAKVERFLDESEECRVALVEWQVIGEFIHVDAATWSRNLPPLSAQVRSAVRTPATQTFKESIIPKIERYVPETRPSQRPVPDSISSIDSLDGSKYVRYYGHEGNQDRQPNRRFAIPLTLVASVITILLFGGLIFALQDQDEGSDDTAAVALQVTQTTVFLTNTPNVIGTPEATVSDLGIIGTETPRRIMPPPTTITDDSTSASALAMPTEPSQGLLPANECIVVAGYDVDVDIYERADVNSRVVNSIPINEFLYVKTIVASGWYEVFMPGSGLLGWVISTDVVLQGPCGSIPVPSPTYTGTAPVLLTPSSVAPCMPTSILGVSANLYISPDAMASIILTIEQYDALSVIGRNGNGWYRVRYDVNDATWVGWMSEREVAFAGACNNVPLITVTDTTMTSTPQPPAISATPVRPFVGYFNVSSGLNVARGENVTLEWESRNTNDVTIEFFDSRVDPQRPVIEPVIIYTNLPMVGTLEVPIPQDYISATAFFVLVLNEYEGNDRTVTSTVSVTVKQ